MEGHARCLLIAGTFPPLVGGSSVVYENLARSAEGRIVILTSYLDHRTGVEHPDWRVQDTERPYPIHRLPLVRPPLAEAAGRVRWGRLGYLRLAFALMWATRDLVHKHGIAVVCTADDETVGWLVPFVKFVLRRATLIYCHGDDLVQTKGRFWRRLWFSRADRIVAASRFASERLVSAFGVPGAKIALIVNGVDRKHFVTQEPPPILEARYGTKGRRVILTPSRLVARKGIDRTLEAMALLLPRYPELLYLIVGEGEQRKELEDACKRLGLQEAVRFAGPVAYGDMPAHYALAEIVVLPNRASTGDEDGLPLVFLEANSCAKPVIGGRAGGTAEVIQDGVNGLLVDGQDAAAIASAIDRVLSDAALRARLIAGAAAASREWDWQNRAIAFAQLCDAVARRSGFDRQ